MTNRARRRRDAVVGGLIVVLSIALAGYAISVGATPGDESESSIDLSGAFAVWAAVVGMIGVAIVWELSRLRSEFREMSHKLNDYIVSMERRQTHTETFLSMKHADYVPHGRG